MAEPQKENTKLIITCRCKRHRFTRTVQTANLPLQTPICHCYQCRHVTGNLCASYIDWDGWAPAPLSKLDALSCYKFPEDVRYYSCSECGTTMFVEKDNTRGYYLSVPIGILQNASEVIDFVGHEWIGDTNNGGAADWIRDIGGESLMSYPEGHRQNTVHALEERLPAWTETDNSGRKDVLEAKCLCGGVHFQVQRPHTASANVHDADIDFWHDTDDRYIAGTCVCESCRFSFGTPFAALAFVPTICIKQANGQPFTPDFGTLKQYRGSGQATRSFCSTCGASVFFAGSGYMQDELTGLLGISVGLFCASSGARADDWLVWETFKVEWEGDSNHEPLKDALKDGIKAWGKQAYVDRPKFVCEESMGAVFGKCLRAGRLK